MVQLDLRVSWSYFLVIAPVQNVIGPLALAFYEHVFCYFHHFWLFFRQQPKVADYIFPATIKDDFQLVKCIFLNRRVGSKATFAPTQNAPTLLFALASA